MSTDPIPPSMPQPSPQSGGGTSGTPSGMSPFQAMFGGTMTESEFKVFINQFLRDMVTQFKQNDASWKRAMDNMKKAIQGDD